MVLTGRLTRSMKVERRTVKTAQMDSRKKGTAWRLLDRVRSGFRVLISCALNWRQKRYKRAKNISQMGSKNVHFKQT